MPLRPAFLAAAMAVASSCWLGIKAQQEPQPAAPRLSMQALSLDPADVTALTGEISQRSERLKPLFAQVNPAAWVQKGAPQVYVEQWKSLGQQNTSVQVDMAAAGQQTDAMPAMMAALFRIHRFDTDLQSVIPAIRRYQDEGLADRIEALFAGDQRAVEKLQQYVLDLANEKERLLDLENSEAQRCRSQLANQPLAQPAARKSNGKTK
ncbi:MAG TPA: hypothetical protein VHC90_23855 [Bryobacteraceae bacterium]|nr:hypothetical protein [Bryobacteraceae bacterium]